MTLAATEEFANNKKTAEKRIFELVNSKIDDLIDTAEYDWWVQTHFSSHSGLPFAEHEVNNNAQDGHHPH